MQSSDALYLFNEGRNYQAYRLLGAHAGEAGTLFRVWAPNATNVAVLIQDSLQWDLHSAIQRQNLTANNGYWSGTVPEARSWQLYRFEIHRWPPHQP